MFQQAIELDGGKGKDKGAGSLGDCGKGQERVFHLFHRTRGVTTTWYLTTCLNYMSLGVTVSAVKGMTVSAVY
jgi:hypothetical protein